ncbi:unnamed protein product, partial [marine sediment metagenome]
NNILSFFSPILMLMVCVFFVKQEALALFDD